MEFRRCEVVEWEDEVISGVDGSEVKLDQVFPTLFAWRVGHVRFRYHKGRVVGVDYCRSAVKVDEESGREQDERAWAWRIKDEVDVVFVDGTLQGFERDDRLVGVVKDSGARLFSEERDEVFLFDKMDVGMCVEPVRVGERWVTYYKFSQSYPPVRVETFVKDWDLLFKTFALINLNHVWAQPPVLVWADKLVKLSVHSWVVRQALSSHTWKRRFLRTK